MIDVSTFTANELASKLRSGEISSVDLCKKYLERIKKFEPEVKAWAHLDKKLLLEKAEEADNYRKSGKPLGSLHGCLLYTSPSPRDGLLSRMPSSA